MSARFFTKCGCFALVLLGWVGQANTAPLEGTPVAWGGGWYDETNVPPSLTNVIAVAAGFHFSLAVKADGTVQGWGASGFGQTTSPAGLSNVVAVAAGYNHAMALRNNGTVVVWGDTNENRGNIPAGAVGIKAIAAGSYHCLALGSNGLVYAWGANGFGQCNLPTINYAVTAIAAGGNHSLALQNNGLVAGWGQNTYGQINVGSLYNISGIGAGDNSSFFIQNGGVLLLGKNDSGRLTPPYWLSGVMQVAGGGSHAVALRTDNSLVVWGDNTSGQTNLPGGLLTTSIGAGATHTVALKAEPASIVTQPPQTLAALAGSSVTLSVTARGSQPFYYSWFKDSTRITGAQSSSLTINPVQPGDAGHYYVYVWNGLNWNGLYWVTSRWCTLSVNLSPAITGQPQGGEVPVGANVGFSVTAGGSAPLSYQWRFNGMNISGANSANYFINNAQVPHSGNYCVVVTNNYGAVTSQVAVLAVQPIPVILTQPRSQTVLAGSSVSFTVEATNATFYQWRKEGLPIPGANSATYSMANVYGTNAGWYSVALSNVYGGLLSSTVTLSVIILPPGSNGLLVAWGERWVWNDATNGATYVDMTPPGGLEPVKIANGLCHSLALTIGGLVRGWGDNSSGQSGPPTSLDSVVDIAAGNYHSLARRSDGTVVGWGRNDFGQADVPPSLANVVAIAAGGNHSLALKSDGTVVGWGNSANGRTVPLVGNGDFKAIAAGENHSLGVLSDSTVVGWGANNMNQTRVPLGLNGVMAVAAGENHSLALRTNGTVVAWGDNNYGQTNAPKGLSNVIAIACGANHCTALKRGGVVVSWGLDNYGQVETPSELAGVLAVSARGNHNLVLKKMVLRLQDIHRLPNGNQRLLLRMEDGSDVSSATFAKTQIYASTNFAWNVTNWVALSTNNIWLIGGSIQAEDPNTNFAHRYYISVQNP